MRIACVGRDTLMNCAATKVAATSVAIATQRSLISQYALWIRLVLLSRLSMRIYYFVAISGRAPNTNATSPFRPHLKITNRKS